MSDVPLVKYLRVVGASVINTWKHNLIDSFVLFGIFVQPFAVALLGLWMLRGKGPDYAIYVVVGSGMSGLWSTLLFVCGNEITMERRVGTLETLTGVPTPLALVAFGKTLANVLQSLFSLVGTYILVSLIFGYPLHIAMPLAFFISLFFIVLSFISFGMVISPLFILNPMVQQFQNGAEFPIYVLSGFLFPILILPQWSHGISYALPTFWAAKALHAAAEGTETFQSILFSWGMLTILSVLLLSLSGLLFRKMIHRAKINGTLDAR